eukprot:TRINITY_DN25307_c0_g1_i1.p1 TRINITY_DN25307_c0_g1~~TRINITY_DN25307_c0_g1_i1.p1  ORF type:complete len:327 (+),score=98.05 TRINITY_DN25307_c0_g1_i1:9-989(+)
MEVVELEQVTDKTQTPLEEQSEEEDSDEILFYKTQKEIYPGKPSFYSYLCLALLALLLAAPPLLGGLFHTQGTTGWAVLMGALAPLSFLPAAAILFLLWHKARTALTYDATAKFFLFGFLLTLPALALESIESLPMAALLTDGQSLGQLIGAAFYFSFLVAALTEETLKFTCAFLIRKNQPTITQKFTILALQAVGALGFASLENYGYVVNAASGGDLVETLVSIGSRGLLSVPFHTMTGVLVGYEVAKRHFEEAPLNGISFKFYVKAVWLPVLLHGLFDVFAFGINLGGLWNLCFLGPVAITIGGAVLSYFRIKELRNTQEEEIK